MANTAWVVWRVSLDADAGAFTSTVDEVKKLMIVGNCPELGNYRLDNALVLSPVGEEVNAGARWSKRGRKRSTPAVIRPGAIPLLGFLGRSAGQTAGDPASPLAPLLPVLVKRGEPCGETANGTGSCSPDAAAAPRPASFQSRTRRGAIMSCRRCRFTRELESEPEATLSFALAPRPHLRPIPFSSVAAGSVSETASAHPSSPAGATIYESRPVRLKHDRFPVRYKVVSNGHRRSPTARPMMWDLVDQTVEHAPPSGVVEASFNPTHRSVGSGWVTRGAAGALQLRVGQPPGSREPLADLRDPIARATPHHVELFEAVPHDPRVKTPKRFRKLPPLDLDKLAKGLNTTSGVGARAAEAGRVCGGCGGGIRGGGRAAAPSPARGCSPPTAETEKGRPGVAPAAICRHLCNICQCRRRRCGALAARRLSGVGHVASPPRRCLRPQRAGRRDGCRPLPPQRARVLVQRGVQTRRVAAELAMSFHLVSLCRRPSPPSFLSFRHP